jgi:hypothetical protein
MSSFEWNHTAAVVRSEKIKAKEKKRMFVRGKCGGLEYGK